MSIRRFVGQVSDDNNRIQRTRVGFLEIVHTSDFFKIFFCTVLYGIRKFRVGIGPFIFRRVPAEDPFSGNAFCKDALVDKHAASFL